MKIDSFKESIKSSIEMEGSAKMMTSKEVRSRLLQLYRASGPTKVIYRVTDVPAEIFELSVSNLKRPIRNVFSAAHFLIGPFSFNIQSGTQTLEVGLWDSSEKILKAFGIETDDSRSEKPTLWLVAKIEPERLHLWYPQTEDLPLAYHRALLSITKYWEDYFHAGMFYCFLYLMAAHRRVKQSELLMKYTKEAAQISAKIDHLEAHPVTGKENEGGTSQKYQDELRDLQLALKSSISNRTDYQRAEAIHLRVAYGPEGELMTLAEAIYLAYLPPSKALRGSATAWPLQTHLIFTLSDDPEVTLSQGYRSAPVHLYLKNQVKPPINEIDRLNLDGQGSGDIKALFNAIVADELLKDE